MENNSGISKKQVSIKRKMSYCFIIVLAMMVLSGIISLAALFKVGNDYQYAIQNFGFSQGYIGQFGIEFHTMTTNLRSLILETDEAEMNAIKSKLDQNVKDGAVYLEKMEGSTSSAEEKQLFEELNEALNAYREIRSNVVEMAAANQNEEAYDLLKSEGVKYGNIVQDNVNQLLTMNIDKCNETIKNARVMTLVMVILICVFSITAVVIGLILSGRLSKGICVPLDELMDVADHLKNGKLDIEIEHRSRDELGRLADSFRNTCHTLRTVLKDLNVNMNELAKGNMDIQTSCRESYVGEFKTLLTNVETMVSQVNDTMININTATSQVTAGSVQMAESAQSLAEGASEQATSVEELKDAITDVTNQVDQNVNDAMGVREKAQKIAQEAEVSRQNMQNMMKAMKQITEASEQIRNIIGSIEEIASQTNLLSLNAAIEAARAGEAGKGFAVVADQVKVLAAQSAEAAKNTRDLIETSIQEVENGNEITDTTAVSLRKVIDGIEEVQVIADKVSDSSMKQAQAVKQIDEGVEQISGVIQNNSAVAQETSATSEELSAQAVVLSELVQRFKLKE